MNSAVAVLNELKHIICIYFWLLYDLSQNKNLIAATSKSIGFFESPIKKEKILAFFQHFHFVIQ